MLIADLTAAIGHGSESESVEYKSSFDIQSPAEWLEIIKDVVSLSNSGGGVIVFGVADSGKIEGIASTVFDSFDPADLTNKVYKYTGRQFKDFNFVQVEHEGRTLFAMLIHAVSVPIVFSKPGTYDIGGGKQKTAFSGGAVYFRHGAKSEPGNSEDLRLFLDRRIEEIRKSWFEGIVKVVEAPPGSQVQIVAKTSEDHGSAVRLVNDPKAPAYYRVPVDETHPYRQKEVIEEFNRALKGSRSINPFHIQCVRAAHNIDSEPTFCYKQKFASARFSKAFVEWLVDQYQRDGSFFDVAKLKYDAARRSNGAIQSQSTKE